MHNASDKILSGLSRKAIRKIPNEPLKKVNKIFNCNLVSKNGHTSAINLTKIANRTRDFVLVQIDAAITQRIADDTIRVFFQEAPTQRY